MNILLRILIHLAVSLDTTTVDPRTPVVLVNTTQTFYINLCDGELNPVEHITPSVSFSFISLKIFFFFFWNMVLYFHFFNYSLDFFTFDFFF